MVVEEHTTDPAVTPAPIGVRRRSLRPLAVALACAAGLSAVAGVAAMATRHAHDAGHRTATGAKPLPSAPRVSKPLPTQAPPATPPPATSSIPATGGPWILFGPGEQATEVDGAGWDGHRSGVLRVAPTSNAGGQGIASFDGRHVIDSDDMVWTADGRFEGDAKGAYAWGDDSHTLCGVNSSRPSFGSTAAPRPTPVTFFTTVLGGASADVATFAPPGIYGDARILACGTGDGSIIADVFSQVGSGSTHQLVRIHHGRITQLLPSMQMSGDRYFSVVATPDGRTVAYSKNDGRVSLLGTAGGQVRTLSVSGGVDALSWNGRRLLMELPLPRQGLMSSTIPGLALVDTQSGAILWRSPNHDAMDTMTLPRPGSDDIAVSLNTHGPSTGVFPTSRLQLVIVRADGREVVVAEDAWLIGPR